jgi:macrophage erythroblast attacher
MPYNLSRQTFKNAQRSLEHCTVLKDLSAAQKAASKSSSKDKALHDVDAMISKMQGLKRKLEGLREDEKRLNRASKARIKHLKDLESMNSLVDVRYEEWSRTRLSRLLVDYLLRSGYSESAAALAQSKGIEELVDVEAFVSAHRIEKSLREGRSTALALAWCKENGQGLKKMASEGEAKGGLEFELRLQQYIELVRQGHEAMDEDGGVYGRRASRGDGEAKLVEARAHAKKWLSATGDFEVLGRAAGLLAYRPWDRVEPYAVCPLPILHLQHTSRQSTSGSENLGVSLLTSF